MADKLPGSPTESTTDAASDAVAEAPSDTPSDGYEQRTNENLPDQLF